MRLRYVEKYGYGFSTQCYYAFFLGVLWLWHFLNSVGPHLVSSLDIFSRAFMAGAASQAGDTDSSRAPGLTSGLQGSVNVHSGALLLVPQWRCISSYVFYILSHCSLCRVELVVQFPARGSTLVLLCLFPGVLWLWHFIYEPLHEKTYNLDWRHNLLKWRHKFEGEIPQMWRIDDACVLSQLVICLFLNRFFSCRYQKNVNMLLYKEVIHVVACLS